MYKPSIADLKAMYDRYNEMLEWYKLQIIKGINYDKHDEYSEHIKELSVVVFNVGRELEVAMQEVYLQYVNKI
jgi:hypothetical protein